MPMNNSNGSSQPQPTFDFNSFNHDSIPLRGNGTLVCDQSPQFTAMPQSFTPVIKQTSS
jgi:hypothetical protein